MYPPVPTLGPASTMTSPDSPAEPAVREVVSRDRVVIRFAGDSGDGMQLDRRPVHLGGRVVRQRPVTLPNFPAEIRAPAGTLPGVSSFQLHFADYDILTPGDRPDVLVAMNPAALKANIGDLPAGGDAHRQHRRVHQAQPGEGRLHGLPARGRLARALTVHEVAMATLTRGALEETGLCKKDAERAKNMFALGCCRGCTTGRPRAPSAFLREKFAKQARPRRGERAGVPGRLELRRDHRGVRRPPTRSRPARCPPGTYRQMTGNIALAYGLVAAGQLSGLPVFLGTYPITPASRHPARAVQAQGLRRHDLPGRGRDRRHRRGAGRVVRRRARA